MAWLSSSISIGDSTRKSHFDQLLDNTQHLKGVHETLSNTVTTIHSGTTSFKGTKTFQSSTIFVREPDFQDNLKVDVVKSRTSTSGIGFHIDKILANATATVVTLKKRILEIGDWNMSATVSVSIAHGIDFTKIRSIFVLIRGDAGETYPDARYPLNNITGTGEGQGGYFISTSDPTKVYLHRLAGGQFHGSNYNATSFNRGWIILEYEE